MRLGRRPSVRIRVFPAHTRQKFSYMHTLLLLFVLILILSITTTVVWRRAEDVMQSEAERQARNLATRLIHEAVDVQILKYNYAYCDFVTVQTDDAGRVQSLAVNPVTVNRLKAEVALEVEKRVNQVRKMTIQIPIASLISDNNAIGFGPELTVYIEQDGYCIVDFENTFLAEGINQTKHQIDIVVKANFALANSFVGKGMEVQTRIPVAQTVIVGNVPESYFEIQR